MKNKCKAIFSIFIIIALSCFMAGCTSKADNDNKDIAANHDFDSMVKASQGSTVTFYGWGGSEEINKWIDTVLAPRVKSKYDITLQRVPMDIEQILNKMLGEKQAGKDKGTIDMIWINGENFFTAKENNLLYGPFVDYLPNYKDYVDENSNDVKYDFGYQIKGYEAPYGKAQMVLINDSAVTPEAPKNAQELLEFAKKYKGKVTYPAPPDFTGSAFVRNIICETVGYEQFMNMPADKAKVKQAIEPALAYLRELNPYLWNEGKSFPATSSQLDNMFADGEVVMNMSYDSGAVAVNIENGRYKKTARTFLFDKGTIGNTNFIAIAGNSPNKAGAMLVINEILSPEMQASRYETLKILPVLANEKLNAEQQKLFAKGNLGIGTITQDELLAKRIPEMPAKLVPIIEEIWQEEVVGK